MEQVVIEGFGGVPLMTHRAGPTNARTGVVFLHGFPEGWQSWRKQMEAMERHGIRAAAVDLRGYGKSGRPIDKSAYNIEKLVADVVALVRSVESEVVHVVGHDWGGLIAWCFAGAHPEVLGNSGRLAIVNAPHLGVYFRKAWRPPQLFRSWYVGMFCIPGLAERLLSANEFAVVRKMFKDMPFQKSAFTEADIDAYIAQMREPGALTAMLNYYREGMLGQPNLRKYRNAGISAETLVLWGEHDPALGVELLEGLEEFAPRLTVKRFPNAGHWLQNELPDEVNAELLRFLS